MARKTESVATVTKRKVTALMSGYTYGWCRASQHVWHPDAGALTIADQLLHVRFVCENCGGTRTDKVDPKTGELVSRIYRHAEGYLMPGLGDLRPNKSDWRRQHYGRLIQEARKEANIG